MIFADKLIQLRKREGWSQEELAMQMNVSRQSVSKWEGAQSIPDLDKIVKLSQLFGVSIDYLLKDELVEITHITEQENLMVCRVSLEQANTFLRLKQKSAKMIGLAIFLFILSPICLFLLLGANEIKIYGISEEFALSFGLVPMFVLVTIGVALLIWNDHRTAQFDFLNTEVFEPEYGVIGMVKQRKDEFERVYTRNNIVGVALCILSMLPFWVSGSLFSENAFYILMALSVCMVIAGIGVWLLIYSGVIWESYSKLLQEGDYSRANKQKRPIVSVVAGVYWLLITAVYFGYSFITSNWRMSWIVWVVGGLGYAAVVMITSLFEKK